MPSSFSFRMESDTINFTAITTLAKTSPGDFYSLHYDSHPTVIPGAIIASHHAMSRPRDRDLGALDFDGGLAHDAKWRY